MHQMGLGTEPPSVNHQSLQSTTLDRDTMLRRLRLARCRCEFAKHDINQIGWALKDDLITVKGALHWLAELGLEALVDVDTQPGGSA